MAHSPLGPRSGSGSKHSAPAGLPQRGLADGVYPAVFRATAGRYDKLAMSRGMPEDFKAAYFTETNGVSVVNESLRKMVTFKKYNLQHPFAPLGQFDVVFLRYVAIYFSTEFKKDLFARVAGATRRPGYLILGGVETLRGFSDAYDYVKASDGFYHTLKEGGR